MAVKFLSASGSGSTSDAVECINYARNMGAHILSNSWGGGGYSQALYDAIGAARNSGIIFVAAAGNDSEDFDGVSYGGRTTYLPATGTVGSRTSARYNGGATGNVDAPASWSTHAAASATPGLANGTTNGTFVEGLRSGLYNETASYRFAATSDVIPGLSIHPETGVVTGMPDVPEGGLFNIVIERHTPTNSTLQSFGLLVGSSSGVYTVPASAAWTLLGNGRIDGTLKASGGLPTPGGWDTEECTIEDIGTASGSRFIRVVVTGG